MPTKKKVMPEKAEGVFQNVNAVYPGLCIPDTIAVDGKVIMRFSEKTSGPEQADVIFEGKKYFAQLTSMGVVLTPKGGKDE